MLNIFIEEITLLVWVEIELVEKTLLVGNISIILIRKSIEGQ